MVYYQSLCYDCFTEKKSHKSNATQSENSHSRPFFEPPVHETDDEQRQCYISNYVSNCQSINDSLFRQVQALTDWSLTDDILKSPGSSLYSNRFINRSTQTNISTERCLPSLSFLTDTHYKLQNRTIFDKTLDKHSVLSSGYISSVSIPISNRCSLNQDVLCNRQAGVLFSKPLPTKHIEKRSKLQLIEFSSNSISNNSPYCEYNTQYSRSLYQDEFGEIEGLVDAIYKKSLILDNVMDNLIDDDLDQLMRKQLCPALRELFSQGLRDSSRINETFTFWNVIERINNLTSSITLQRIRKKAMEMTNDNAISLSNNRSTSVITKIRITCYFLCLFNSHQLLNWLRQIFEVRQFIKCFYKNEDCIFCNENMLACFIYAIKPLNNLPFCLTWPQQINKCSRRPNNVRLPQRI